MEINEIRYEQSVNYFAENRIERNFRNFGKNNALVVLKNIFRHSEEEVLVFAGNSKGDVANDETYVDCVSNFLLSENAMLKILVENPLKDADNFGFYDLANSASKNNKNVQISTAPKEFIEDIKKIFGKIVHFTVADGRMYRLETDPENFKAICSFNDSSYSRKLKNLFLTYFPKS